MSRPVFQRVGQAHAVRGQPGMQAHLGEGGGVGHQRAVVLPQRCQRQVQAALDVGEQRALAFALQDGAAVGRREREVGALVVGMVGGQADAVVDPALEAGQRDDAEQARRLAEEGGQRRARFGDVVAVERAGSACRQIERQRQVVLQCLGRAQSFGHRAQRLQQRRDGGAVRRFLQAADGGHHRRQRRRLGEPAAGNDARPVFEEGEQGFGAAAKLSDDAGGFEKIRQFGGGYVALGRRVAFVENVGDGREAAVERRPGRLRLRVGHQALARVGDRADAGDGHRIQPKMAAMA
jgi:hypothetical protein